MSCERGFFGKMKWGWGENYCERAERQAGLVSEKEMGIMVGKGKSFQKSPIQEYGRGPHFACFVLPATNALPTLCTSYLWPSLPSPLSLPCASSPVSYSIVFSLCLGQKFVATNDLRRCSCIPAEGTFGSRCLYITQKKGVSTWMII